MTYKVNVFNFLFLFIFLNLTACGGGGSGSGLVVQGQFIDSLVIGLRYQTPTQSGFTNSSGQFNYIQGETVTFYVGDVLLGNAPGQAVVTPIELVSGAKDETNIQVQNIVMFLQSIDDDRFESNGINITQLTNDAATGETVDFLLASGAFETNGAVITVISNLTSVNGTAQSMLPRLQVVSTFNSNLLTLLAGDYQGTFTGDDTGSWSITITKTGDISGQLISDSSGTGSISGSVSSNGDSVISGLAGSSVFSGVFTRNGVVSGVWSGGGDSGSFKGKRITDLVVPGSGTGTGSSASTKISIINSSFEVDEGLLGCFDKIAPTGWTTFSVISSASCSQGSYNPTPASSFSSGLGGTGSAWLNGAGYLSQVLGATFESNTTYTLSAYVGVRNGNGTSTHSWAIQLLQGGFMLAEKTGVILTADQGVLKKVSVSYFPVKKIKSGENLEIRLVLSGDGSNPQLAFDSVTLTKKSITLK